MANALRILLTTAGIALGAALPLIAEEGVTHYDHEISETLEQALDNFVTYNRKLAAVVARDPLTPADMEEAHELTYTLEVALARINAELGALPVVLERVHITSEGDNPDALKGVAGVYLESAALLDR